MFWCTWCPARSLLYIYCTFDNKDVVHLRVPLSLLARSISETRTVKLLLICESNFRKVMCGKPTAF